MGIRIVYAPKASLVGEAAYQGGLGEFNRFSAQMWDRAQDRTQRERMQGASLAAQAESQDRQFRFQAERDQFQAQTQLEAAAMQAEKQQTLNEQQFLLGQHGADAQAERQKQLKEFEFTQQEKLHNAKLDKQLAWVQDQVQSGLWTPEQGAEAEAQIMGAKKPPSQPMPTLAEQVERDAMPVSMEQGGGWWVRDPKGGIKYQMPPKDSGPSPETFNRIWDSVEKRLAAESPDGVVDSDVVAAQVFERMAAFEKLKGQAGKAELAPSAGVSAESLAGDLGSQNARPPYTPTPEGERVLAKFAAAGVTPEQIQEQAPRISSEQEYKALPAGTPFYGPDGKLYLKN